MAGRGIDKGSPEALATWALIDTWDGVGFPDALGVALLLDVPSIYWNFIVVVGGTIGSLAQLTKTEPEALRADLWAQLALVVDDGAARAARAAVTAWDEDDTAAALNRSGMLNEVEPADVLMHFCAMTTTLAGIFAQATSAPTSEALRGIRMALGS